MFTHVCMLVGMIASISSKFSKIENVFLQIVVVAVSYTLLPFNYIRCKFLSTGTYYIYVHVYTI